MIGDKYLGLVWVNMLQTRDLDADAIETAYQAAPYLRCLMRKIPASVKNSPNGGNDAESESQEKYQRPKPDGMIDN